VIAVGFEYKIAFRVEDAEELKAFLLRLPTSQGSHGWPDYTVALEPDGFYFCDNCKSSISSQVFRQLVDKALDSSDVTIREL
jgi:hypothetical protein